MSENKHSKTLRSKSVTTLTVAAMMTAISVVIGIFCKNFLNFGAGLFRVTFENLPIILAGVSLGPIAGALVGIASDLLSYLLSFQAYAPNLIVTAGAASVGLVSGLVARFVVKTRGCKQMIVAGALAHIVGSMLIKPIGLYQFYGLAVLWRVPMYFVIAPVEILLLCLLIRNEGVAKLIYGTNEKRSTK